MSTFPSGVMSSVTRILFNSANSSDVMSPSGAVGSSGSNCSASAADDCSGGDTADSGTKGVSKNGGGVVGLSGKTPAKTEL